MHFYKCLLYNAINIPGPAKGATFFIILSMEPLVKKGSIRIILKHIGWAAVLVLFACQSCKKSSNGIADDFARQCHYLDSLDFSDAYSTDQFDSLADKLELDGQKVLSANARLYALREESFESKNDIRTERRLNNILTQAQRGGWTFIEAEVRHMIGEHCWHARWDKKSGLMQYFRAYQLYKDMTPQQYPHKFKNLYNYAGAYSMFDDLEAAIRHYLQAIAIGDYYDKGLLISAHNSLGLCYKKENKIDSAIHFLKQGLAIARKNKAGIWIDIIEGNLGAIYFLQNRLAEAEPLLLKDVARGAKGKDWRSAASSLLYLSQLEQKRGQPAEAMKKALLARAYTSNIKQWEFNILLRSYEQLSTLYAQANAFKEAYLYNDSARQIQDTLQKQFGKLRLLRTQQMMDEEKYAADLDSTVQKNKYFRNILIAVIVLLTVIALLILGSIRMKHQQRQKQLDDERRSIQRELEIATAQLIDYTRHIEEKNELIEQFKKESNKDTGASPDPESLSRLERMVILTDEQWNEFTLLFEKVHGNFFQRLREKVPGLSPADTRFMALGKLQLPTKSMAAMLGITPNGVRMSKSRIMKKLNIENDEDLDHLIRNI
jgi:DNA-binding CsgD family transcriptional regulator